MLNVTKKGLTNFFRLYRHRKGWPFRNTESRS